MHLSKETERNLQQFLRTPEAQQFLKNQEYKERLRGRLKYGKRMAWGENED